MGVATSDVHVQHTRACTLQSQCMHDICKLSQRKGQVPLKPQGQRPGRGQNQPEECQNQSPCHSQVPEGDNVQSIPHLACKTRKTPSSQHKQRPSQATHVTGEQPRVSDVVALLQKGSTPCHTQSSESSTTQPPPSYLYDADCATVSPRAKCSRATPANNGATGMSEPPVLVRHPQSVEIPISNFDASAKFNPALCTKPQSHSFLVTSPGHTPTPPAPTPLYAYTGLQTAKTNCVETNTSKQHVYTHPKYFPDPNHAAALNPQNSTSILLATAPAHAVNHEYASRPINSQSESALVRPHEVSLHRQSFERLGSIDQSPDSYIVRHDSVIVADTIVSDPTCRVNLDSALSSCVDERRVQLAQGPKITLPLPLCLGNVQSLLSASPERGLSQPNLAPIFPFHASDRNIPPSKRHNQSNNEPTALPTNSTVAHVPTLVAPGGQGSAGNVLAPPAAQVLRVKVRQRGGGMTQTRDQPCETKSVVRDNRDGQNRGGGSVDVNVKAALKTRSPLAPRVATSVRQPASLPRCTHGAGSKRGGKRANERKQRNVPAKRKKKSGIEDVVAATPRATQKVRKTRPGKNASVGNILFPSVNTLNRDGESTAGAPRPKQSATLPSVQSLLDSMANNSKRCDSEKAEQGAPNGSSTEDDIITTGTEGARIGDHIVRLEERDEDDNVEIEAMRDLSPVQLQRQLRRENAMLRTTTVLRFATDNGAAGEMGLSGREAGRGKMNAIALPSVSRGIRVVTLVKLAAALGVQRGNGMEAATAAAAGGGGGGSEACVIMDCLREAMGFIEWQLQHADWHVDIVNGVNTVFQSVCMHLLAQCTRRLTLAHNGVRLLLTRLRRVLAQFVDGARGITDVRWADVVVRDLLHVLQQWVHANWTDGTVLVHDVIRDITRRSLSHAPRGVDDDNADTDGNEDGARSAGLRGRVATPLCVDLATRVQRDCRCTTVRLALLLYCEQGVHTVCSVVAVAVANGITPPPPPPPPPQRRSSRRRSASSTNSTNSSGDGDGGGGGGGDHHYRVQGTSLPADALFQVVHALYLRLTDVDWQ